MEMQARQMRTHLSGPVPGGTGGQVVENNRDSFQEGLGDRIIAIFIEFCPVIPQNILTINRESLILC
jgi:hypothetical protein